MAVNQPPESYALPCGRTLEELWEHLQSDGLDAHEQSCPHCRTAADGLDALAAAARALQADSAEPPPDLIARIMRAVRAEVRRGRTLTLPAELGPASVSEQAVAVVLRYAADTVDGVRARRCRLHQPPHQPGTMRVEMSLALRYGTGPIDTVAAQVRERVTAAAGASIGLHITAIDLYLDDLWPLSGPGAGRSAERDDRVGRPDGAEQR